MKKQLLVTTLLYTCLSMASCVKDSSTDGVDDKGTKLSIVTRSIDPNIANAIQVTTFNRSDFKLKRVLPTVRNADVITSVVEQGDWYVSTASTSVPGSLIAPVAGQTMAATTLYQYAPALVSGKSADAADILNSNSTQWGLANQYVTIVQDQTTSVAGVLGYNIAKVQVLIANAADQYIHNSTKNRVLLNKIPNKIAYSGGLLPSPSAPSLLATPIEGKIVLTPIAASPGSVESAGVTFKIPAHQGTDYFVTNPVDTTTQKIDLTLELERQDGSLFSKTITLPKVAKANQTLQIKLTVTDAIQFEITDQPWITDIINPNIDHPELTVSAVSASINNLSRARIYFTSNQPKVSVDPLGHVSSTGTTTFSVNSIFDGIVDSGSGAPNLSYTYNAVTGVGTGYVDLVTNFTTVGSYNHRVYINAGGLKRQILTQTDILPAPPEWSAQLWWVGAYWRANQTGERIIHSGNATSWSAEVIYPTGASGDLKDFVLLTTERSLDNHLGQSDPGDAEGFKLTTGTNSVSGSGRIYFRIGMASTYPLGASTKPRYAMIKVISNTAMPSSFQYIYVRQGEAADYIGGQQSQGGTKWSPYNVGDRQNPTTYNNGGFTAYPSQAGYYYQSSLEGRAYSPSTTLELPWLSSINRSSITDVCPEGYHTPSADGSTGAWAPTHEFGGVTSGTKGSWGYYADGYFDRRSVETSQTGKVSTAVTPTTNNVAYSGALYSHATTLASIFLPSAGIRSGADGAPSSLGIAGYYWASTKGLTSPSTNQVDVYVLPSGFFTHADNIATRAHSIRCVKNDLEYPPAHKGWAGSNIYWDATLQKLTFDDVNVTTHQSYQGLFFMYGSLVAISPAGYAGTASDVDIIFDPRANPGVVTLENIPYLDLTPSAVPAGLNARDRAFLYVNTNAAAGKGDICKYMTSRGWGPGGKKWRMPTINEMGSAADYPDSDMIGSFNPIDNIPTTEIANKHGQYLIPSGRKYRKTGVVGTPFMPASGYMASPEGILMDFSVKGVYWSSSAAEAEFAYFSGFDTAGQVTELVNLDFAFSVRCVVE